jgi:hypothetical protein
MAQYNNAALFGPITLQQRITTRILYHLNKAVVGYPEYPCGAPTNLYSISYVDWAAGVFFGGPCDMP